MCQYDEPTSVGSGELYVRHCTGPESIMRRVPTAILASLILMFLFVATAGATPEQAPAKLPR